MLKGLKDYFRYLKDTAYKNIIVKTDWFRCKCFVSSHTEKKYFLITNTPSFLLMLTMHFMYSVKLSS